MLRILLATIGGIIIAMIVVGVVEAAGHYIYPPPAGIDVSNQEELVKVINNLPFGSLAFVVLAWVLGAISGAVAGTWLAPVHTMIPALLVGAVVTLGVLYTLFIIPHPAWMMIAGLVLPLPAAWGAARMIRK